MNRDDRTKLSILMTELAELMQRNQMPESPVWTAYWEFDKFVRPYYRDTVSLEDRVKRLEKLVLSDAP